MSSKMFHKLVGTLFAIVALAHLLRIFYGWSVNIGPWNIPVWVSIVGAVVAAYLSYSAFKLAGILK
jgi:hypothetical protein